MKRNKDGKGSKIINRMGGLGNSSSAGLEAKLAKLVSYLPEQAASVSTEVPDPSQFIRYAEKLPVLVDGVETSVTGCESSGSSVSKFRMDVKNIHEIEAPFQLSMDDSCGAYVVYPLFSLNGYYVFSRPCGSTAPSSFTLSGRIRVQLNDQTGDKGHCDFEFMRREGSYDPNSDPKATGKWDGGIWFDYQGLFDLILGIFQDGTAKTKGGKILPDMEQYQDIIDGFFYFAKESTNLVYRVSLVLQVEMTGDAGGFIDFCDGGNGFHGQQVLVLHPVGT